MTYRNKMTFRIAPPPSAEMPTSALRRRSKQKQLDGDGGDFSEFPFAIVFGLLAIN